MSMNGNALGSGSLKGEANWDDITPASTWIKMQPADQWSDFYESNGYLVINNLLTLEEVEIYRKLCDKMLNREIDASAHRHDLGDHIPLKTKEENVCQIMWPSLYINRLEEGPLHQRLLEVAKIIVGPDAAFDFDMLMYKAPHTDTETPWHQDESYWADLPDKRTATCWVALDNVTVENGCMWFVPGSRHEGLRPHKPVKEGHHSLECCTDDGPKRGIPVPLPAGSCSIHHGRTLHHAKGNSTDTHRRGYVANFRPVKMIEYERERGYDHGKAGLQNNDFSKGQGHLAVKSS